MHQDPSLLLPPFHFVTPRGLFCPNYVEGRLTREGSGEHAAPQYGGRMDASTSLNLARRGDRGGGRTDLGGVENARWSGLFVKTLRSRSRRQRMTTRNITRRLTHFPTTETTDACPLPAMVGRMDVAEFKAVAHLPSTLPPVCTSPSSFLRNNSLYGIIF